MAKHYPSGLSPLARRDRKQDARQNIDMAMAAIERNQHFNVCFLNEQERQSAARALARAVIRALHGRRIEAGR